MRKVLTITAVLWVLLAVLSVPSGVTAAGTVTSGMVLKTKTDTQVYQEASETSGKTDVLEAGTSVYVTDDTIEGWSKISSKEVTGYVRTESLTPIVDSDEIKLEFEQIGNNYHMIFNEVQQLEKQQSQKKIWGTVIILLTAGIFAAGVIPVIKKNGKNEKTNKTSGTIQ